MRVKYWTLITTVLMLLMQSCSGNEDADMAFKAATAGMNDLTVLRYADNAYVELTDLSTEDACKLTLAYFYLYREYYSIDNGKKFGDCYKYAISKDEVKANDYFNALTGSEEAATKIKNSFDNIGIMEQASDVFTEMKEYDLEICEQLNSLPSNELQTGAMAFFEPTREQRHYFMPDTYSALTESQKRLISPLGLVIYNSNLKLIVNNEDLNSSTWYYAQEKASSCHTEDIKSWRLMTLSEGRALSRIYENLLYWADRWHDEGIACDMAIACAYTSTTNGEYCYTIDIRDGKESLSPKDEDWLGFGRYVSPI